MGISWKPTILDGVPAASSLANTEIFGPVLSLIHASNIDEAIECIRKSPYGNQASLFTTSGGGGAQIPVPKAPAGNIGISYWRGRPDGLFPVQRAGRKFFSGFCTLQGKDAVEFYTESKYRDRSVSRQGDAQV